MKATVSCTSKEKKRKNFRRPTKIKFAMEKKRKRSDYSNPRNPKRRATPVEYSDSDSPLARLFNDVGIKVLATDVPSTTVENGKKFLFSIQGMIMSNDSPEECAKDIYDKAFQVWMYQQRLLAACTRTMDEEPCFSETLVAHANNDSPEQRMASMMKDPWLGYVLRQSEADIIRGFLSILIAYWNMKDLLDKFGLIEFGPRYIIPKGGKYEFLCYAVDHIQDFQNLKEVLDSKYGHDPHFLAYLFYQISEFQVNGMNLAAKWKSGRRSMIQVVVLRFFDGPPFLCKKSFSFWNIPYHELPTI